VGRPATRPWECAPETAIVLRILQEIDDRDQLRLGLIPRHIGERHTGVLFHEHLGAALTDVEKPAHALLLGEAAEQEEPDAKEGYRWQDPRQHIAQPGALQHAGIGYVVLRQAIGKIGFDPRCHDRRLAPAVRRLQAPGHRTIRHQHFGHAPSSSAFSNSL
jgi:hypothetical protein